MIAAACIAFAALVVLALAVLAGREDTPDDEDYCVWCGGLIADRGCDCCRRIARERWGR